MNLRQTLATLPRDARDTLFLLFVIAWVIAPQAGNLPVWASVLAGGLLLWRGWLAWKGRPLPGRWTVAALLVVAVAGTLFTHRTVLGRDAGVTLIVMLLALKTLELRARRDAMVVFFLGFFTMLSNFFFSQSLFTAAAMLVKMAASFCGKRAMHCCNTCKNCFCCKASCGISHACGFSAQ